MTKYPKVTRSEKWGMKQIEVHRSDGMEIKVKLSEVN
jgi:hypothetical protein